MPVLTLFGVSFYSKVCVSKLIHFIFVRNAHATFQTLKRNTLSQQLKLWIVKVLPKKCVTLLGLTANNDALCNQQ